MVWVGRDLKDHLVQPPCHGQEHLSLDQASERFSNLTLNMSSDGAPATSLGNMFHCLTTLVIKKFFLILNVNLPFSI